MLQSRSNPAVVSFLRSTHRVSALQSFNLLLRCSLSSSKYEEAHSRELRFLNHNDFNYYGGWSSKPTSRASHAVGRCFSASSMNNKDDDKNKHLQKTNLFVSKPEADALPTINQQPPSKETDHFSVTSAYSWLMAGLSKDKSLSSMAIATIFMAGEGLMANQPAILLGRIVDEVGSVIVQDTTPNAASTITSTATSTSTQVNLASEVTNTAVSSLSSYETIWPLFTLIGACIVAKEVCTIGRKYLVEKSATSLQKTAFLQQAQHLLAVRVDALEDQRVGSLVVKLDKSVEGLIKLQKVTFLEGAPNIMAAAVALGYACSEHAMVGTTMIGVVFVGGAITGLQIMSQKGIRIKLNEKKANMGAGVVDLFNNLGYIRASGMRTLEESRLAGMAEKVRSTEFLHHKWMMSFDGTRDVVEQAGFVMVVGGAVHLALAGEITSGAILTLAMLYSKATTPLQKMHKVIDQGHEAVIKVGIMGPLRALPSDPGLAGSLLPQRDFAHPLVADNLSVHRGGKPVLKSLSLKLNQGEIVGVAGTSGSGKSTLLKCALGLIPDYQGSINLLGCEAREADKIALSQALLYAQQEPFVLTGTIRDNLLATTTNIDNDKAYSDNDLLVALERASLAPSDFTNWSTLGLDTPIHEGGRNLSGGQKQRLALARIFLLIDQAQVVILDEATSALDNLTEASVIDELEKGAKYGGATVIMVAHRLSTLKRADRVMVMDDGKIVQNGTYEELKRTDGIFRELLEARAKSG